MKSGLFPNDRAAVELLGLAKGGIEENRARACEKVRKIEPEGTPWRSVAGRFIYDSTTTDWKRALAPKSLACPERINRHFLQ